MKYIFINVAVISGLLLVGTLGFAQEHDRVRVVQKIRDNIDQIQSVKAVLNEGDGYSLSQVNRDLDELQNDYAACQCNQGNQTAYDDLVFTLQSAVNDNRITGRDHEIMQEDLNLLRGTAYSDTQAYAR
jgi:hypothetical protein